MKNTPCTTCIHLKGNKESGFKCGALNNTRLSEDIVFHGAELNLPDCPFHVVRRSKRPPVTRFDPDKKKLVAVTPTRRNRKYDHVKKVIIAKIPQLEKKLSRLPTGVELHRSLGLYTEPKSTYRILDSMVSEKVLVKKPIGNGGKQGYEIAQ